MALYRRAIPQWLVLIFGASVAFVYFYSTPQTSFLGKTVEGWGSVVGMFTIALGIYSLVLRHGMAVKKLEKRWYNSAALLVTFAAFVIVGWGLGQSSPQYTWLGNVIFNPLSGMSLAFPLFGATVACYKALRVRNLESLYVLAIAIVALYGRSPIGPLTPIVSDLYNWLTAVGSAAGNRALILIAGIGAFALALRTMLGFERRIMTGPERKTVTGPEKEK